MDEKDFAVGMPEPQEFGAGNNRVRIAKPSEVAKPACGRSPAGEMPWCTSAHECIQRFSRAVTSGSRGCRGDSRSRSARTRRAPWR